jgi:hypothetical protein
MSTGQSFFFSGKELEIDTLIASEHDSFRYRVSIGNREIFSESHYWFLNLHKLDDTAIARETVTFGELFGHLLRQWQYYVEVGPPVNLLVEFYDEYVGGIRLENVDEGHTLQGVEIVLPDVFGYSDHPLKLQDRYWNAPNFKIVQSNRLATVSQESLLRDLERCVFNWQEHFRGTE